MEYTIHKDHVTVTVSNHGAELQRLSWNHYELLWSGKKEIWPRRAPVCFPWCGKMVNDEGIFNGRKCRGPLHGFIRDLEHTLVAQGEDFLRFRITWAGNENWPWPFFFETDHQVIENGVMTTCAVTNTGVEPMAMQLGFHPGFACPFLPGTDIEEYQVHFENGLIVPLKSQLFDNDSIRYNDVGMWARLEHQKSRKYIQIGTKGFFCVLLWSQSGIPGFLCIEPWQGYPGPQEELNQRPGTVILMPEERREWQQIITVAL